ncbi:MAG: TetR/AcrR family transcriptional regulator [Sandaracinaceae bacterium]
MPRPKDADSEKTYDRIVQAARELVNEQDTPDALSLRQVSTRAEVSLGTIQYYFESKEGLLEACLDAYYERLQALGQTLAGLSATLEGRAMVEEAARQAYRFSRAEVAMMRLRRSTSARRGELHPRRQAPFLGEVLQFGAQMLAPHAQVEGHDLKLSIQTMAMVVSRMAGLSDDEVQHLVGHGDIEQGRRDIEEFVVRAARRLVRPMDG